VDVPSTPDLPATAPGRRRPHGLVRQGLIDAGIELARHGGPDAVVLREATRRVGVAPNAAYRHFEDRDALLNEVCRAAMRDLAARMEAGIALVPNRYGTKTGAKARLRAIGEAYLDFATREPGLFETAFSVPKQMEYAADAASAGQGGRTPFQLLGAALDELAAAGVLPEERRPNAEFAVWSGVHGMAMLTSQGPLRELAEGTRRQLAELLFASILRSL
jgi:AcrR family transcriptional regulator